MQLSDWAEGHARDLLKPLGRRWRHSEAVAAVARELASLVPPGDADVLVASAYLHDVGYAPSLAITGFHPLDGARHLRSLGNARLAGLVAYHTAAREEAELRGLGSALSKFDDERGIVSAALAYCDLTVGPSGERMTPEQRRLDVEARYGKDSPVTASLRSAWPELLKAIEQVDELQRQAAQALAAHPR
ncbi:MAG: HD domain-containing protein [Acidimicrobiia bacterium]|nr:HD domain-containing protein [Acidimicrobiia bacterium]MBT8194274.1 HD domain-containing protein [Acidimicrobiia bacterium]NNJ47126.1 HD domain-containing protein [Acidimicrobiia bacterium]NNL12208.1 HD domain-containing protein [Acidimicrobiia bacterium]